jgi:hypothetical protein
VDVSFDEIAYLDFAPDLGAGLRERALEALEEHERNEELEKQGCVGDLLIRAAGKLADVLDLCNASETRVEVKNTDGDGSVYVKADGMQFRVTVVFPAGGGDEPTSVNLSVKTGNNWSAISSLADLGRWVKAGSVDREEDKCATD